MTYPEALDYVASLSLRGWRLGLDRMEELVRRAGLESTLTDLKFIHVAGTNGKGSVTAYVQSILTAAGRRTGGFFSPFVYDITERIQFGCEPISREDFARHVKAFRPTADSFDGSELGSVTEFEFKTAMGLAYWKKKNAEWVALEVGLGGRLDATNVVAPAASVIVSIGLDHTAILGETLAEIAGEKAGILKAGRPAVIGNLPEEALTAVREAADRVGTTVWEYGRDYSFENGTVRTPLRTIEGLTPPLPGRHQGHNMAVAVAALDAAKAPISDEAIRAGLAQTKIPGRFERRSSEGRLVLLDGAHNADSIAALVETIQVAYPDRKFALVFGMVDGHDPGPVVARLESVCAEAHLTPIDFRRTLDPADLARHFKIRTAVWENAAQAFEGAKSSGLPILVTGSFYLVGEIGNTLAQ